MQANHQVAGWHGLSQHVVGVWQHLLDERDALRNGFGRTTCILDRERTQLRAFPEALRGEQFGDLIRLATQANQQHTGKVGMAGVAA